MATYNVQVLSGTPTSGLTRQAGTGTADTGGTITDQSGSTAILGDVATDTFTISGFTGTFTYYGTATASGGGTGFVALNSNGSYYYFSSQTALAGTHTITTTRAIPGDTTPASNGQFDLTTNSDGCFLGNTHITTTSGETPVEALRAGDMVMTSTGVARRVRWVGVSHVSRVFMDPLKIVPIRIKAGALGHNVPSRDLCVSPGHAVFIDGLLVHASALVNGSSIVRETDIPLTFLYYHVELDCHDVIIAENTPVESFLEATSDVRMDNWAERDSAQGEAPTREMDLPRVKAARQLPAAIRAKLDTRAETFRSEAGALQAAA